jgi:hypothetical protein
MIFYLNWILTFKTDIAMALTADEVKDICQQANVVEFEDCHFLTTEQMRSCIKACGDLKILKIYHPMIMENVETMDEEDGFRPVTQKIETVVISCDETLMLKEVLKVLQLIHNASIDVDNIELDSIDEDADDEDVKSVVSFLKKHYQDRLRKICVDTDLLLELLKGFSHLKLKKLAIFLDLDEQSIYDLIRSQHTITDLRVVNISEGFLVYAFQNLPLLCVLEVCCLTLDDLGVLTENYHLLRTLTYLRLEMVIDESEINGCDITFISKIPNLQKFYCWFFHPPSFVKLAPFEKPMLQMREFHLKFESSGADIDAESMWNIFNLMPNLEKITVDGKTAKVCG